MNSENNLIITFDNNHLFCYAELTKLITATYSYEKIDIIKYKLRQHMLINKKQLYIYNPKNITYYKCDVDNLNEYILLNIRNLIELSHSKLNTTERENFDLKHAKTIEKSLFKTAFLTSFP